MSAATAPTQVELFNEFIRTLSNCDVWKNIYNAPTAINIIRWQFENIKSYINGKNNARIVVNAISKNKEISQTLKQSLINYLEQNGMVINKYEILFENASQIDDCTPVQMFDRLAPYIKNKLIDPNFQTDLGNIFHILTSAKETYDVDKNFDAKLYSLVECGCDITAINQYGETPMEAALDLKNDVMCDLYAKLVFYKTKVLMGNNNILIGSCVSNEMTTQTYAIFGVVSYIIISCSFGRVIAKCMD